MTQTRGITDDSQSTEGRLITVEDVEANFAELRARREARKAAELSA